MAGVYARAQHCTALLPASRTFRRRTRVDSSNRHVNPGPMSRLRPLTTSLTLPLLALHLSALAQEEARTLPLDPAAWDANGLPVRLTEHLGADALYIGDSGPTTGEAAVELRDFTFRDGTLEYDHALDSSFFSAVHFRRRDAANSEHAYLRTFFAGETRVNEALQYAAILGGVNYWDISPEYQAAVAIDTAGYNHVKLVARGRQLLVYVNDMERPALYVPRLDTDIREGSLGFAGRGYYANLTYSPATPGLAGDEGYFAGGRDGRYVDAWRVSPPDTIAVNRALSTLDAPEPSADWDAIEAERFGLVNLSRPFGKTPDGERRVAYLTTAIESDRAREVEVDLGFSDEVAVFVNGALVYVGENIYGTPQMSYPRGRLAIENANFRLPLEEGVNRVTVALANDFFGWGLKMRVRDPQGLTYDGESVQ